MPLSLVWVFHPGHQGGKVFAQLFLSAAHQQGILKRILRQLEEFGHVFVHDFDFFGAGNDAAVVAVPFRHVGHGHISDSSILMVDLVKRPES